MTLADGTGAAVALRSQMAPDVTGAALRSQMELDGTGAALRS